MTNTNSTPRSYSKVAAQVATEAIINEGGEGYEIDTMMNVLIFARDEGVADLYTSMLSDLIDQAVTRRDDADRI